MPAIGDIFINIQAGTATFASGVAKINANLLGMQVVVDAALKNLSRAFDTVNSAFQATVGRSLQYADQMGKAAQITGVNVEALSGLRHAADLSNVSFEELQTGLAKFSKHLVATGKGGKDVDAELMKLADRFARMEDGAGKTALAMERFGRAGAKLIPFLNAGSGGIQQLKEEAAKLGLVIDNKTAIAAEKFNDNMTRLRSLSLGLGNTIATALLPTLNVIAERMVKATTESNLFKEAAVSLNFSLKTLASTTSILAALASTLGTSYRQAFASVLLVAEGDFAAALEALRQGASQTASAWEGATHDMVAFWGEAGVVVTKEGKKIQSAFDGLSDKGKRVADQVGRMVDKYQELLGSFQATFVAPVPALTFAEELAEGMERSNRATVGLVTALAQLQANLQTFKPEAIFVEVEPARTKAVIDSVEKLAAKGKEIQRVFQDFSHVIGKAFEDAILSGKGLRGVLAGLAEDLARILLRIAITKPLEAALTSALGGGAKGGILSSIGQAIGTLFGGRQFGGPVFAGQPVMVGERGPEMFVPSAAGHIVARGAGGVVINNYIDARGGRGDTEVQAMRALKAMHVATVKSALHAAREAQLRRP